MRRRLLFLPGMSGDGEFWAPVAAAFPNEDVTLIDYPGLGTTPPDANIAGYDDLVHMVVEHLRKPCVVIAQSMGGYVAIQAARQRAANVTHLVLAATSAGIDLHALGVADWRPGSRQAHPNTPDWAYENTPDLTDIIASTTIPVLLLWAADDPISPQHVGGHLAALFPNAHLSVFDSDDHWFARIHAATVAATIEAFLNTH